ncbi:MAG: DUF3536 domain-containing protein [Candidatus Omnitrophica bacterium]|nr:DUF3536 domain-containing protein [Candidatus Omnitrophota bacterium]
MKPRQVCLCVHGHFYQPPRENAWLEEIEEQESAKPAHDWNERIYNECYRPNTAARVLDAKGKIIDVVSNFKWISFNFGPTLLSWMQEKHPDAYQAILDSDRQSCLEHYGHGNAIAQVYNHIILPLANARDKVTQVRWGIEDFRHRFGRSPEAMWLAETACNEATLEVLVDHGMKYLILSPYQADSIRPIDSPHWQDASDGKIDPSRPYRCYLKKDPSRYIDIFFYDGPVSRQIGFGDLLFDAKLFMASIEKAKGNERDTQLIHVATDGETYGHHKAYGERVLAYVMNVTAPKHNYRIVNYGEYLAENPPQFAVKIQTGEDGMGTSWSCAHGVKRWKEHCGCRGDGPAEWTQHWRKPLKESLDWLSGELALLYEGRAREYLKDVWEARNDYIQVILDRSDESVNRFFQVHQKASLKEKERVECLKLLEMQRHSMLMHTSCGWFFTELSGIETVQILQYAARAIQLAFQVTHDSLEEAFMERLSEAKSNVREFGTGRQIYERFVLSKTFNLKNAASMYAMASTIHGFYPDKTRVSTYCFDIKQLHHREEAIGNLNLSFGHVRVCSRITWEEKEYVFAVVQIGLYDFRCSVKPFTDILELENLEKEFFDGVQTLHIIEILRKMDVFFGKKYYALKDLPIRERKQVISILTREAIEKISVVHENLYDENRRMSEIYSSINLPLPAEVCYAVEHTLSRRLLKAVQSLAAQGFNLKKTNEIQRLINSAKSFGIKMQKKEVAVFLDHQLLQKTKEIAANVGIENIQSCLSILKLAEKIEIELNIHWTQDILFSYLKKTITTEGWKKMDSEIQNILMRYAALLGISEQAFQLLTEKTGSEA